ncbi:MAG: hypothetical protein U0Y68_05485 [Blastocatellia bacterium]
MWTRWKELKGLTQLSLNLSFCKVNNVDVLKELKSLTQLSLVLGDSEVSNVGVLKELKA